MRTMRNTLLFLFAASAMVLCAVAMSEEDAADVTVEQYLSLDGVDSERSYRAQYYAYGLFRGSYVTYVQSLISGGLSPDTANKVASAQCGNLTLDTINRILRGTKEAYETPLHVAVPLVVDVVCRRKDAKS